VSSLSLSSFFNLCTPSTLSKESFVYFVCPTEIPQLPFAWKYSIRGWRVRGWGLALLSTCVGAAPSKSPQPPRAPGTFLSPLISAWVRKPCWCASEWCTSNDARRGAFVNSSGRRRQSFPQYNVIKVRAKQDEGKTQTWNTLRCLETLKIMICVVNTIYVCRKAQTNT